MRARFETTFIETDMVVIVGYSTLIVRACELNKSHIIYSTDEDPGLRIESFAVINLRGVSTNNICGF